MTLPASGTISLTDVMNELRITNPGRAYPISIGDADVRALSGVPSGAISLTNLYGKSAATLSAVGNNSTNFANSQPGAGTVTTSPSVTVSNSSGGTTYNWSVTSQSGGCTFGSNGLSSYSVSHTYTINANGNANAVLQCIVQDNTGHSVTVTGITATLSWNGNA